MANTELERRFHARLIETVEQAKRKYKYHPHRFLQLLAEKGCVRASKQLLEGETPAEGFGTLFERGQFDGLALSLEAVVAIEQEWHPLFTEGELARARQRLIDVGYPLGSTVGVLHSAGAAEPVGAYPHARRVGNLLFLSGVGPRRRGSKDIPGVRLDASGTMIDYDIEAQVRSCFENVRIILREAGSSWEKIVDVLVFLTDTQRDFAAYNRVYAEYFPAGPNQPTRTTIGITALPQGGSAPIAFEVKVVATV